MEKSLWKIKKGRALMNRAFMILFVIGVSLIRCSNTAAPVAGGTVIPNLVVGNVVDENAHPAENHQVGLKKINIYHGSDSVLSDTCVFTDEFGAYRFGRVNPGKYIIEAFDDNGHKKGVITRFEMMDDSIRVNKNIVLEPVVELVGRVVCDPKINKSRVQIFIPGLTQRVSPGRDGVYHLSNVSQGDYEIAFAYGDTVNFMPVSVKPSMQDTVYIRDALLEIRNSTHFVGYGYHNHNFEYSYSVLPQGYKKNYAPKWYQGKDFTSTTYYGIKNDSIGEKYEPDFTMLFIVDSDTSWYSDVKMVTRLEEEMDFSVFIRKYSNITYADTQGIDIIYISSSVYSHSLAMRVDFKDVAIPIIVSEDNMYPYLKMSDTVESIHFGDGDTEGWLKIVAPKHYIAKGFDNYVKMINTEGYLGWAKPGDSAVIIASYPKNEKVGLIFCYDRGDEMVGMKAPQRRIGFFLRHTINSNAYLTEKGWLLFRACVNWAIYNDKEIVNSD